MQRTLLIVGLLALAACGNVDAPACPVIDSPDLAPSAGCLAVVHGRVLVVENRLGKLSPPGGRANEGESAQCAAHRETFEETGLDLIPGPLAATFDTGFKLYYCGIHPDSGLIEPHMPTEVKQAYWLLVQDVDQASWRFPGQGEILRALLIKHKEESTP